MNNPDEMIKLMQSARTIAVVGLSDKPWRASHNVALYLQSQGYRIIPVNPNHSELLGEVCYPDLRQIPRSIHIDIVNVFRRPDAVLPIVEDAKAINANAIWMQDDVINWEAAEQAERVGMMVVMDRCLLREHARHVQESH